MSFHIIRAVAKKKVKAATGIFRKKPKRVDENLPLGVKIERLIDVDAAALLTFHGLIQFSFPSFPATVEAIGKIDLGEGAMAYRCYLQGTQSFVQIVTERDEVVECRLYVLDRDIYPATEEVWELWLNPEDGIIGCPEVLHGDTEELSYIREWMDGDYQAEPVLLHEQIINDPYDENLLEESQHTMSYFRVAHGDPHNPDDPDRVDEYLLVSAGEGVVEMYLGVDLMVDEITVI
jgi:hypothetical protein